jgi:hypothetical protein
MNRAGILPLLGLVCTFLTLSFQLRASDAPAPKDQGKQAGPDKPLLVLTPARLEKLMIASREHGEPAEMHPEVAKFLALSKDGAPVSVREYHAIRGVITFSFSAIGEPVRYYMFGARTQDGQKWFMFYSDSQLALKLPVLLGKEGPRKIAADEAESEYPRILDRWARIADKL